MDKISEWMDGELTGLETRRQIERLKQDPQLHHCWVTFHLIGDVMRGERALSRDFNRRLAERLAVEPTVLAPRAPTARRFATYALSAAASLSAVAIVGWMVFVNDTLAPKPESAQSVVASQPEAAPAEPQLASVPSDGTMNEYIIAHQEFSPSTEIQGLAPYIRSVSGARQARDR
jgi:sigma-E factor negative regulatory protein RseA